MRHRGLSALLGVSVVLAVMFATSGGTSAAVGVAFTVDSAADSSDMNVGNGICATATGACTLRAAIQESNASVGSKDTVAFALRHRPSRLHLSRNYLPSPIQSKSTDHAARLRRQADRRTRGDAIAAIGNRGLRLRAGDSLVRGLVINRFDIDLILIERPAGDGIRIAGNYIGTDVTGSVAAGGERGIFIGAGSNHVIGGSVALDRNVISGNSTQGINIVPNPFDVSSPAESRFKATTSARTQPARRPSPVTRPPAKRGSVRPTATGRSSSEGQAQGRAT